MFSVFNRKPKTGKIAVVGKPDKGFEDERGLTSFPNDAWHASVGLEPLPSLRTVAISDRPALLRKKLALCTIVYDFTDHTKHLKEKEIKKQNLSDILDYVSSPGPCKITSPSVLEDFFRMISANIFRSLPFPIGFNMPSFPGMDAEEDELCLDPAWQHLQYVYECLLRVLHESDAKTLKKYIDHSFVLSLMDLFDTEDPRERESLKMILHRIYGKFMVHRPFIRKTINNIFYRFIFESENHNGTGELLEILGSIINGFVLPLKEEHKIFLSRTLIPLHKPRSLASYHQQLSYCVVQFVEKDFKLAENVILGLVKYWPLTNSHKEVLILGELEEVLEATHVTEFRSCMVPLFKKIRHSLSSSHFQVAERALLLWSNDHILRLIQQNYQVILPLVFGALEISSRHWNKSVHNLTQSVKQMFQDMDEEFFCKCHITFREEEAEVKAKKMEREKIWEILETATPGSLPAHLSC